MNFRSTEHREPSTQNRAPRTSERSGPSFITGVTGFVGRHLARHLVGKGEEVSGIDLVPGPGACDFSVSMCNILDFEKLKTVIKERSPVFVYHLAGLVHPKDSLNRPREYYLVNVQGTVNLLEALRQNEIDARVLIVSSSKVYGRQPPEVAMIDETRDPRPETPYALSKYLSEQTAMQYFRSYGTKVIIARPFNHTGPGQPPGFVVPDFCKQIAELEALPRDEQAKAKLNVGDLSPIRDFLDVRDVVRAYEAIVKNGNGGECYNVSSGLGLPISELLDRILTLSTLASQPAVPAESAFTKPWDHHIGSSRKLQEAAGWKARYALQQTLQDTLEYWRGSASGR